MDDLKDKTALITGAGRANGIGAAIARKLARRGANIVIADLGESAPTDLPHPGNPAWEEMQSLAEALQSLGVRCLPLKVDVTDSARVAAMVTAVVEAFGRLDILVNNAGGIFAPAPVVAMEEAAWRKTLEVNATGTFLCCQAALPVMIQAGRGGRVVNIASLAALRPRIFMSAYAASKAAVVALTQSLAQEVAQFGITVNAVLPGDIDTAMKQWGLQLEAAVLGKSPETVVEELVARIPVGRLGLPEDVANLVAFLASEEAAFITGQAYPLTGGRELG